MISRSAFAWVLLLSVSVMPRPALAQDRDVPMKPFSVPLRDVGIVTVPVGALGIAAGAGLILGTSMVCVSCSAHPDWLVPDVVTLILGFAHLAFGVPAIVVGNHRVHRGPVVAVGPGGVGVTF